MLGFSSIEKISHGLEDVFKGLREGHYELTDLIIKLTFITSDCIKRMLLKIQKERNDKINTEPFEEAYEKACSGLFFSTENLELENLEKKSTDNENSLSLDENENLENITSIRINIERINEIIRSFDNLIIRQFRFKHQFEAFEKKIHEVPKQLKEDIALTENAIFDIQHQILNLRMLPLDIVLTPIRKEIQEEALRMQKDIHLNIPQTDFMLDKVILEQLKDILLHLVRNAIDHGIESQEQRKLLKKDPKEKIGCIRLCLKSIKNCCNEAVCYTFKNCEEDCECCCCCCCDYREEDYDKDSQFFCYCYQAQRKSFWCNKFITNDTQKKILPFMIEYFLLQLITIGFDKQIEKYRNKMHLHIKSLTFVFILTLILYFYFSLSFSKFIRVLTANEDDDNEEDEDEIKMNGPQLNKKFRKRDFISKMSNEILDGTHGIIFFNSVFSLIFSSFYLSNVFKNFIFEEYINIIFIPILMNKFYYFTLNYYCIYTSEKNNSFELISGSTLISIYLIVWDYIIEKIKNEIPERKSDTDYDYFIILYIIQIVFSSIPSLIIALYLICGFIYSCLDCITSKCDFTFFYLHKFLFCLISFFLCGGGLWIRLDPDI